jgi:quercetin dioxygenase-like cupin family protein
MIVAHEKDILPTVINHPDVKSAAMRVLVGPQQGWSDHVMRVVELGADGYSPDHTHDWPHINYMIEGSGVLTVDGREYPVQAGGYAYVPAGSRHQFRNSGQDMFRFICIVPKEGHK